MFVWGVLVLGMTVIGALYASNASGLADRTADARRKAYERKPDPRALQASHPAYWRTLGLHFFLTGVALSAWILFDGIGLHLVGLFVMATIGVVYIVASIPAGSVQGWWAWARTAPMNRSSAAINGIVLLAIATLNFLRP